MFETNPLAHGMIEVMKDHVVGEGFSVSSEDEEVQRIIDRHWNDWQNLWDLKQHDRVRELSLYGEQMYVTFIAEGTGNVRLASIDPINVRRVVINPENPEEVVAIIINSRHFASSAALLQTDKLYRVIHKDEDPASSTFNRMIGAQEGETLEIAGAKDPAEYDGSCFWFTVNKVSGATRGRSDLLSDLDWLDVYDQILMNFVDRTLLMNSFVWDVELKGATPQKVTDWLAKYGKAPKPGTVRVHGEQEKWTAVAPSLQAQEFDTEVTTLKSQILSAQGLPPHWFGDQDANRATAVEMGSPILKRLSARQLYVKHMISQIIQFQIDQAAISGDLTVASEGEETAAEFTVQVPEMSVKDLANGATALNSIGLAIQRALGSDTIDVTVARQLFALVASAVGADIDIDEMVERIEAAQAEEAASETDESKAMSDALDIVTQAQQRAASPNGAGGLDGEEEGA
jgi:hypothetical protein